MKLEILPELWLGDKDTIRDTYFLQDKNINCIINCTKHINFNTGYTESNNIRIDINNEPSYSENVKLLTKLNDITELIHKYLTSNKSVLVFCDSGKRCATAIIISYLMRYGKIELSKCISCIELKCMNHFDPSYFMALEHYEKNLKILYK